MYVLNKVNSVSFDTLKKSFRFYNNVFFFVSMVRSQFPMVRILQEMFKSIKNIVWLMDSTGQSLGLAAISAFKTEKLLKKKKK